MGPVPVCVLAYFFCRRHILGVQVFICPSSFPSGKNLTGRLWGWRTKAAAASCLLGSRAGSWAGSAAPGREWPDWAVGHGAELTAEMSVGTALSCSLLRPLPPTTLARGWTTTGIPISRPSSRVTSFQYHSPVQPSWDTYASVDSQIILRAPMAKVSERVPELEGQ